MATILYGAPVREYIKNELIKRVQKLGRKPVLAILQVGERSDSNIYIKNKIKFGEEIGVTVLYKKYPVTIEEEAIIAEIKNINTDVSVDGIIIQLPLPENLNKEKILAALDIKNDVDGLSVSSTDENLLVTPATARGVVALLRYYQIEVDGKKVAVIGRSKLTGGPIAEVLKSMGAEVSVYHKESDLMDMKNGCRKSDILVSATGQVGLVTTEFVNKKQIVIDIGINKVGEKLVGDVAFEEVEPIVYAITPVPGGVGPLTVACLFENLLDLCYNRA